MNTTIAEAQAMIRRGYCLVPILRGEKRPRINQWQKLRITLDDVERHFKGGENVGLLLGEPSGGLIDVDMDCSEAVRLAHLLFSDTEFVFGRQSRPCSHRLYVVDGDSCGGTTMFNAPGGGSLVEYRSTGAQTVVPPSRLKIKGSDELEPVVFQMDGEPGHVSDGSELLRRVSELAAASLLVRHYPSVGGRNEYTKALSGTLDRMGWGIESIEGFIRAVATVAGDEEIENRLLIPKATAERRMAGRRNSGSVILGRIVGEEIKNWVCPWLGGVEQRHRDTEKLRNYETGLLSERGAGGGWSREGGVIFSFAREIQGRHGQEVPADNFEPEVRDLHQRSLPHMPWPDVWETWLAVYPRVLKPSSLSLPESVLAAALHTHIPARFKNFTDRMTRLGKLSIALQAEAGLGVAFSLSTRQASRYLDEQGHKNAWNALQSLQTVGFLKCVERGTPGLNGRSAKYIVIGMGND